MGSTTREIVTLQLGHYSNFVGTHWWNLQDSTFVYKPSDLVGLKEVDNDVLFREGVNPAGEVTYTPRLVLFDLKDSLRTLKEDGELYDTKNFSERSILWSGGVNVINSPPLIKNRFLQDLEGQENVTAMDADTTENVHTDSMEADDSERKSRAEASETTAHSSKNIDASQSEYNLDDSVTVWSDYLRPYFYPKSIHIINEFEHESETCRFDVFGSGERLYNNDSTRTTVENRLRFFTEECDRLQGFQLLADSYNGFGGFTVSLLDDIADDYSNKAVTVFLPSPVNYSANTIMDIRSRIVNDALSYERLLKHSSMIVPMSLTSQLYKDPSLPINLPNISYKPELSYHTSSILAASIDTLSLPYRLIRGSSYLSDLTHAMTRSGRKVVALRSSFPLSLKSSLTDTLMSGDEILHCFTPHCLLDVPPYCQSVSLRGVTKQNLHSSSVGMHSASATVDDIITMYMKESYMTNLVAVSSVEQRCHVGKPFPGPMINNNDSSDKKNPDSVAVMTCLESSTGIQPHIEKLRTEAKNINLRMLPKFSEAGLELDDFRETLECLASLSDCYSSEQNDMD